MLLITLMVMITLATESTSDTKVWMYSTDIDDPKNWIDGKIQKDCSGLVFSEYNDISVFIRSLKIRQLVLPKYGTVRFEDGAMVLFEEDSTTNLNCVELNPFLEVLWFNSTFWKNLENPDNPAVPFSERIPSKYDDIILPKGFNSSISFIDEEIAVKSITLGKEKLTQKEIDNLANSEVGKDVFPSWLSSLDDENRRLFEITGAKCRDPTGCDRRPSIFKDYYNSFYTNSVKRQCSNNIDIKGNMLEPICGAQILINTLKTGFTIDKINKKLKEYKSDTHASKYELSIQIIFTEKDFTGSSLIEATEFYNILREDDSYFCEDVTLKISGPPLNENNTHVRNAFSIIFGTLFGVVLMFGLLFFVYSPTVSNLNLRNRFRSTRPLSTYILRYDNMDDRADIIDGQSIAGSVLALNRSFDNPLYDHAPSTRSTSNETIMSVVSPKLEEDESEKTIVLDSAKELEDIDLNNEELGKKSDVLLKDL